MHCEISVFLSLPRVEHVYSQSEKLSQANVSYKWNKANVHFRSQVTVLQSVNNIVA